MINRVEKARAARFQTRLLGSCNLAKSVGKSRGRASFLTQVRFVVNLRVAASQAISKYKWNTSF